MPIEINRPPAFPIQEREEQPINIDVAKWLTSFQKNVLFDSENQQTSYDDQVKAACDGQMFVTNSDGTKTPTDKFCALNEYPSDGSKYLYLSYQPGYGPEGFVTYTNLDFNPETGTVEWTDPSTSEVHVVSALSAIQNYYASEGKTIIADVNATNFNLGTQTPEMQPTVTPLSPRPTTEPKDAFDQDDEDVYWKPAVVFLGGAGLIGAGAAILYCLKGRKKGYGDTDGGDKGKKQGNFDKPSSQNEEVRKQIPIRPVHDGHELDDDLLKDNISAAAAGGHGRVPRIYVVEDYFSKHEDGGNVIEGKFK